MGNVPIMNTATMNRKFSLALKAMATEVDETGNGDPRAETVTQLDDTLSMVKNMDYFGKTTKQARNQTFYTIPVKLSFKDRDTRITAESNLRKLCRVRCTVPYHSTLRDVMKKVLDDSKQKYKDAFIQVKVDAESMCLKVSYLRDKIWYNDVEKVELPDVVFDTSNKVSRSPRVAMESMDTEGGEKAQG